MTNYKRGDAVKLTPKAASTHGLRGEVGVCLGLQRQRGGSLVVVGWSRGTIDRDGCSGAAYRRTDVMPATPEST